MEKLIQLLDLNHLTIGSCESLTGGLFASRIVDVSGASRVYKGSVVTYSPELKEKLLNIPKLEIDTYGVVSKQIASLMANHGQKVLNVDLCVSFTGNAGPDVLEGKPVGCVYIGFQLLNHQYVEKCQFNGTREEIREACVKYACDYLKKWLKKENGNG